MDKYQHLITMANIMGWDRAMNKDQMLMFTKRNGGPDDWVQLPYSMDQLEMVQCLARATKELQND